MSTALTLEVSDEVLQGASLVAAATKRDVTEVLEEVLRLAFGAIPFVAEEPIADLPDAQVLALAESRMPSEKVTRLSELLYERRSGTADPADDAELTQLIQTYRSLWLRQSEALAEAVSRGLRPPLTP